MASPVGPIIAGYNREGVAIHNPKEVEKDIYDRTGGTKVKYINKTRQNVSEEVRGEALFMARMAKFSFFSGGAIGGVLAAGGIAAAVAGVSIKAAVFAAVIGTAGTPLGWAMAGLAVVGLAIMLARHIYLKKHGLKTETPLEMAKGAGWALGGFCIAAVITGMCLAAKFGGGGGGGGVAHVGGRYGGGYHRGFTDAMLVSYMLGPPHHCCYHVEYSSSEVPKEIFEEADSKGVRFVYKGDRIVKVEKPSLKKASAVEQPDVLPQEPEG